MSKKLNIDSLSSEINAVKELLNSAQQSGDIVGEMQLEHRLKELSLKLESLQSDTIADNSASVALFFGGQPVLGSKGIAAEFAGLALEQFQNLIAKVFASNETSALGERGKVPFKANSELMVTGLARGSFGFVLDEMSDQMQLESSQLSHVLDKASVLLRDIAAQDEAVFEALLEELEPRTLIALKEFFSNLDSNKATIRVVERDLDFTLDGPAIHRAKIRTEATSIEEKTSDIDGVLVGFLPEHRKFELQDKTGQLYYGSATTEAVEQFVKATDTVIGKPCLIRVTIKTLAPLNRPPREVVRLLEFLRFGE
ncbi:MAG: hypothetical protein ACTIMZ_17210 [Pseudoalteromonas distincta]|uniref:hypothetical protein n=1 Tax=Pseudoalteromonas distincta TaxID=77608 RepID=UPI003F989430